jgi:hypothetical protein
MSVATIEDFRATYALPTECADPGCVRDAHSRGLCSTHYGRHRIAGTLPQRAPVRALALSRFAQQIEESATGCWEWTGSLTYQGYGQFTIERKNVRTHRLAYELAGGELDETLVLDHLCRNRACCNPAHLEQVDQRTNTLRGVGPSAAFAHRNHCSAGHEYTEQNTRRVGTYRFCRTCDREKARRLRAKWRSAAVDEANGSDR